MWEKPHSSEPYYGTGWFFLLSSANSVFPTRLYNTFSRHFTVFIKSLYFFLRHLLNRIKTIMWKQMPTIITQIIRSLVGTQDVNISDNASPREWTFRINRGTRSLGKHSSNFKNQHVQTPIKNHVPRRISNRRSQWDRSFYIWISLWSRFNSKHVCRGGQKQNDLLGEPKTNSISSFRCPRATLYMYMWSRRDRRRRTRARCCRYSNSPCKTPPPPPLT